MLDRFRRSIAQRGFAGTIQLSMVAFAWMIFPRFRHREARRQQADAEFDSRYGVDTGGVFRPKSNQVVGANWAFGGNYQAIDPSAFVQALRALQLPFQDFTFVDLGSGKGRTLMLASLFPFKKVIGVEYCRALSDIARQNIARFQPSDRLCATVDVQDGDAAEFQMPGGPLLLFLFHPFAEQVMSKVVKNVVESYRQVPRRIVVVYFIPNLSGLWEATGVFHRTQQTPAVFDTQPVQARAGKELFPIAHALYLFLLQAGSDLAAALSC